MLERAELQVKVSLYLLTLQHFRCQDLNCFTLTKSRESCLENIVLPIALRMACAER